DYYCMIWHNNIWVF
nr:immunoglobulin light chain junction region [Macaca mulatta]